MTHRLHPLQERVFKVQSNSHGRPLLGVWVTNCIPSQLTDRGIKACFQFMKTNGRVMEGEVGDICQLQHIHL